MLLSFPTIRPRSYCRRIAVATISGERPAAPPTPPQDPDATVDSYVTPPSLPTPSLQSIIPPSCANREATILGAHQSTAAVHAGKRRRSSQFSSAILNAIQVPIVQSSTFTFKDTNECILYNQGKYKSFEYGRYDNPTTRALEEKIIGLGRCRWLHRKFLRYECRYYYAFSTLTTKWSYCPQHYG